MRSFFELAKKVIGTNRAIFIKSMLFVLLMTAVQAIIPLVMRDMLARIELAGGVWLLVIFIMAYAGMQLISNVVSVGWYYTLDKLGGYVLEGIRTDLCRAVFAADYQELMRYGRDKLKHTFYMDTINVYSSISMQSIMILSNLVLIIVFLAVSAYFNAMLTLVLALAGVAGFLISMLSRKPIAGASIKVNKKMKEDNGTLNECIDAIELIKTNELSEYFVEKCRNSVWSFIDTATRADMPMMFLKNLSTNFHQVVSFAVAGFLTMTVKGASAGDLVYYLFVSNIVLETSQTIEGAVYTLMKNSASFENVAKLSNLKPVGGSREIDGIENIAFEDVSFSYGGEHQVLSHKNLYMERGDVIRVAGGNGAGKSTILKLIAGLLHADGGRILINGVPMEELSPACLRKDICYINQDEILLNGSVKNYLEIISGTKVSDDRLREFRNLIRLDDSVAEITGNGMSLSGGQRKKLLMLKLLLRCEEASVILIDEIEAGLDIETQEILTDLEREILRRKRDGIILKISHFPQMEGIYTKTIEL